ncbi:MAG: aminoacyl-tRNA hydrolase [Gammaproteobacteria bacterium]|nr:MAG: aminoacyl-tRNA hydrolase [Gammaproteobacteria bacterium]
MSRPIRLLVGLGNPDPRDARTRHNAGFRFADAVASRWGASFRSQSNFFGDVADCHVGDQRLRLLKPMTFMNNSGRSVAALANFYRLESDEILIAHDEIDLPPGTVRLKRGGGHGGHNGLRDIIPQLGSPDFARLRIGVGHPGDKNAVVGYVLKSAPADEQRAIDDAVALAVDRFPDIATGEFAAAMNFLHRKAQEPDSEAESNNP